MLFEKDLRITEGTYALDKLAGDGEALERLREVCGERDEIEELLVNDDSYIAQSKTCLHVFNELKNQLSTEQKKLLYDYEEELSRQKSIRTEFIKRYFQGMAVL